MKAKLIYAVVFAMIAGSWIGNVSYYRYYRLPEGGFLNHHIETSYVPGASFDLLYAANSDDKKVPISVRIDALPALRFYPAQVQSQLSRQTVHLLRGYFDEDGMEERASELAPIVFNRVNVLFSDGTESVQPIGTLVAYREAWPFANQTVPFSMSSGNSSSDHSGGATIEITSAVTLTDISSRWLSELGSRFQYEWKENDTTNLRSASIRSASTTNPLPVDLKPKDWLTLRYKFEFPKGSADALNVYNVLLRHSFEDSKGQYYSYPVFANYLPYPTETEMRAYVKAKRREAK